MPRRLITISPDSSERHAYIGINRGEIALELFAQGFFEAGIQLLEDGVENRGPVDLTVYPAIYLVRHGTELILKHISYEIHFIGEKSQPRSNHHRVLDLWDDMRSDLQIFLELDHRERDFGPGPLLSMGSVRELLIELHNLDREGDAWRYPTSVDGETHLADVEYVHLRNALEVSRRLWLTLRTWAAWAGEAASDKRMRSVLLGLRPLVP